MMTWLRLVLNVKEKQRGCGMCLRQREACGRNSSSFATKVTKHACISTASADALLQIDSVLLAECFTKTVVVRRECFITTTLDLFRGSTGSIFVRLRCSVRVVERGGVGSIVPYHNHRQCYIGRPLVNATTISERVVSCAVHYSLNRPLFTV